MCANKISLITFLMEAPFLLNPLIQRTTPPDFADIVQSFNLKV